MYSLTKELKSAQQFIESQLSSIPQIGLILGSGLGFFAEEITRHLTIPYEEIPHFPQTTVEGHAGELVFGKWENKQLVIARGRQHYYEGYTLDEVTFATRLFSQLGAKYLIITNASGCINPDYSPGEFMTIRDHFPMVHWMLPEEYSTPKASQVWDCQTAERLHDGATGTGITLRSGTYAWVTGPSYETPAEIRFLRNRGADAVGMSTVPEAIAASQQGMRVLGISCFTNYAAGLSVEQLDHEDVQQMAERVKEPFGNLVKLAIGLVEL